MDQPTDSRPAGYLALIEDLGLVTLPPRRGTRIRSRGAKVIETSPAGTIQHLPPSYAPGTDPVSQLAFALKYDGVNLEVLSAAFEVIEPARLAAWVRSKPTGKYARRAWFLYEWLTGRTLDVEDAPTVAYVDALDGAQQFTAQGTPSSRHRVRNNLLGTPSFCPTVYRTDALDSFRDRELASRLRATVTDWDPALVQRAAQFLYLKETKSTFEIERERPDEHRTRRFVRALRAADMGEPLDKARLVEIQRAILDPRYARDGYRTDQNYVGETLVGYRERVHFVPPKPGDVEDLMDGWLASCERLRGSEIDPVVQAALIGFGFVFVHPFDDGNGRLHRYLIHHVLTRTGFTLPGLVLPVSAVMLADRASYDAALESFSLPLMECIEYELRDDGDLIVQGDTARHYRYFDGTRVAEYLYSAIERTIEVDIIGELQFLDRFDRAWRALRNIVDMPDRRLELFLRICLENNGRLSARKRGLFAELDDDEVAAMEQAIGETRLVD